MDINLLVIRGLHVRSPLYEPHERREMRGSTGRAILDDFFFVQAQDSCDFAWEATPSQERLIVYYWSRLSVSVSVALKPGPG